MLEAWIKFATSFPGFWSWLVALSPLLVSLLFVIAVCEVMRYRAMRRIRERSRLQAITDRAWDECRQMMGASK